MNYKIQVLTIARKLAKSAHLLALGIALVACKGTVQDPVDALQGKRILSFSLQAPAAEGTIDDEAGTIALLLPIGTDRSSLVASFEASPSAQVQVGSIAQVSGATVNDFSKPVTYAVEAADGTRAYYRVTVGYLPDTGKSFTSFTLPGSLKTEIDAAAGTVTVTMPFGSDLSKLVASYTSSAKTVKIGTVSQKNGTTENNFLVPIVYTLTSSDLSTASWTVAAVCAPDSAKAITAFSFPALGLRAVIDESAKTIVATLPYGTDRSRLVAAFVRSGVRVEVGGLVQVNGKTANDFSLPVAYVVYAEDGTSVTYTASVGFALNTAKAMTSFRFSKLSPAVVGTVNETVKTITATVPYGTNLANLVASFTTTGVSVSVSGTAQESGVTPNNFTSALSYRVTAADGSIATYSAIISVALNPAKAITAFSVAGTSCVIDEVAKTITGHLVTGTSLGSLAPTFSTTGAKVEILPGPVLQASGSSVVNFTSAVTYLVTAADGLTATYLVTILADK
jgi:hypothetical protein